MRPLRTALCALLLCLVMAVPALAAIPPESQNTVNSQNYEVWSSPVESHLYTRPDGGLTRVQYTGSSLLIQNFTADLEHMSTRSISPELPVYGGFYAGENYLYVFSGQSNWEEDNSKEVIRVTQYDHNWNRIGQTGLFGANTVEPFKAGSLRCDEHDGYLYVRTCHQMYVGSGGLNHQANLTFALHQEDMVITDAFTSVWNDSRGYVSHSFNQFILVNEEGYLMAMDHGDAYPRSFSLFQYMSPASGHVSYYCARVSLADFPGPTGQNETGASLGGLAETRTGYVSVYNNNGLGSGGNRPPYFQFVAKDLTVSDPIRLSDSPAYTPVLAPTGLDGGWVLWNDYETGILHYAPYDAQGNVGATQTVEGVSLSDCQPIPYRDGVLWYVVKKGTLLFHHLTKAGLTTITDFPDAPPAISPIPGGELYYDPTSGVITGCSEGLTRLELPETINGIPVTTIGYGAFSGQDSLTEVILPDTLTTLGADAFANCTALTAVNIPAGVTAIPDYCFGGCESLSELPLPDTITMIGSGAFAGCIGLTNIRIPDGVSAIYPNTFQFCTALTDIFLPESVTYIGDYAFRGCCALERIVLPASLTTIYDAFPECDALEQVLYTGTPEQWEDVYIGWFNPDIFSRTPTFVRREDPAPHLTLWRGEDTVLARYLAPYSDAAAWLARYDENGRCTGIELLPDGFSFSITDSTESRKLMVLDETLSPIAKAISI